MENRFKKQDLIIDNDKDKFNLACNLLIEQIMQENSKIGIEQAIQLAFIIVSDVMTETMLYRTQVKRRWDFCTAIHYN